MEAALFFNQARSLPTDKLKLVYMLVNGGIYVIQAPGIRRFPIESKGRRKKLHELAEILPSALVLYILRKLPPKRVSAQYHPIRRRERNLSLPRHFAIVDGEEDG
ncbi:hypothetical protein ACLOJK_039492 [Asimina triloba]